ncbi:MAG: hypothetical protein WBA97_33815, partial [Actinophytocola sp.]|uniref:hypothetical protein n=1 Tax=Actinophytocola sp. TaxID=1872138 RepID=UPI003C70F41B
MHPLPQGAMLTGHANGVLVSLDGGSKGVVKLAKFPVPKPIKQGGKPLLGGSQPPSSALPNGVGLLLKPNGGPLILSGDGGSDANSGQWMVNGPTDRTVLPVDEFPSQLGSHPDKPPLPNVQRGLPSGVMSVDGVLGSGSPLGNHPPSHRHLRGVPNERGQLLPSGDQGRQLRHGPSRLAKSLPSSDKLPRHGSKPRRTRGNDLSGPLLEPLKLINPLLVGPLQPSLVDKPGKRPGNLPQPPSPTTSRPLTPNRTTKAADVSRRTQTSATSRNTHTDRPATAQATRQHRTAPGQGPTTRIPASGVTFGYAAFGYAAFGYAAFGYAAFGYAAFGYAAFGYAAFGYAA